MFSQQQLNIHTEGYNSSGRMAFEKLYFEVFALPPKPARERPQA